MANDIVEIKIAIPRNLYEKLLEISKSEGFEGPAKYIETIIEDFLTQRSKLSELVETIVVEKLKKRIERMIQDEVNKGLNAVEALKKQVLDLYDKMESLEQKINELEATLKEHYEKPTPAQVPQYTRSYKTGIERLRDEKIVFESKLPPRIQRDRLFSYFERMGAVVIKLSKERVAIDSEFWREFKNKLLNEIRTIDDNEIKNVLGTHGYELWKALYNDNAIIYDSREKKWKIILRELADK
ncbi:MAG: CopG family transcriptional regulator [Desulfurococcaceae archaeon]